MSADSLNGRHILVAEDEYLIADDLRDVLLAAGAHVIGPFATVSDAIACAAGSTEVEAAVLDVNLRGDLIFPVADALNERRIPFLFATGYDRCAIPDRFETVPRLEKPLKMERLIEALLPLLQAI
jgi:DNA-binding NtrC family response regulator